MVFLFLIWYLDKKVKILLLMRTHSLMSIGLFYKKVGKLIGKSMVFERKLKGGPNGYANY